MSHPALRRATRLPLLLAFLFAGVLSAAAHEYRLGDLLIDHPWSRATPGGAMVAGGFMQITNKGTTADRLIGGSFVESNLFEVHEMAMQNGVMRMRALEKGLEIAPGQTVELKPGGYHAMFIDLKRPLKEGDTVKGTLRFEKAGTVEVEFKVEARGAAPAGHGHHGGMKH